MKIIVDTKENISKYIADVFKTQLEEKPQSSFAFTADESIKPILEALSGDFSNAAFFNVCDFISDDGEKSLMAKLEGTVLKRLAFCDTYNPNGNDCAGYDEQIDEKGGIDLILLGMGTNGTIGFNEPTTAYDTKTRIQKLTDVTKKAFAANFDGIENVPENGVTMGLKTICDAKTAIVAAFGIEKAEIVHKLVYGKTTTYVPAAMLQMHRNMILCLDSDAAAKL